MEFGDTVTFAYDAPPVNPLRGTRGNPVVPDISEMGVRNDSPPPPTDWSATLTVKDLGAPLGCQDGTSSPCSTNLTSDAFVHYGLTYRFLAVQLFRARPTDPWTIAFKLDRAWPQTLRDTGTMQVRTAQLSLGDAMYSAGDSTASWTTRGAGDFTADDTVSLRLTESATSVPGGAGGNSAPSPTSSQVSGTKLKMTFDEPLSQGLAPPGGSFKVTAGPGPQGGVRGNGGVRGMGGAGANGGGFGDGFGTGAQATSGGRTIDIPGTGTVTVDGTDVTVTLARAVPPGSTVTVTEGAALV